MSVSTIMNTAASGMLAQGTQLGAIANNIANLQTSGYDRQVTNFSSVAPNGVQATVTQAATVGVDPTMEITDMMEAKTAFDANAVAFETGADLWQALQASNAIDG